MEASPAAEQQWSEHVAKMYATMLMRKAKGWFTVYNSNSNVASHEAGRVRYFVYNGGAPKFRATITDVAEQGYAGIVFSGLAGWNAADAHLERRQRRRNGTHRKRG